MKKGLSIKGILTVGAIALAAVMVSRKVPFIAKFVWGAPAGS